MILDLVPDPDTYLYYLSKIQLNSGINGSDGSKINWSPESESVIVNYESGSRSGPVVLYLSKIQ